MHGHRKYPTPLQFHGVQVDEIAAWGLVSRETAYCYKIGERAPGRQVARLVEVHRDGKILCGELAGFVVRKDRLYTPEGEAFTAAQLRGYAMILQWAHSLAQRAGEQFVDEYYDLLKVG